MSTFRRRLMLMAMAMKSTLSAWFRSEGYFRSEPW
jgi:hypothetical protein